MEQAGRRSGEATANWNRGLPIGVFTLTNVSTEICYLRTERVLPIAGIVCCRWLVFPSGERAF